MPSLTVTMDLGSDGNAAMHACLYKWRLAMVQWADASHGATRDFSLLLNILALRNFWVLMVCTWNLPHGNEVHKDGRFHQMQRATAHYFDTADPRAAPLYQANVHDIYHELVAAGVSFPAEQDRDIEARVFS